MRVGKMVVFRDVKAVITMKGKELVECVLALATYRTLRTLPIHPENRE